MFEEMDHKLLGREFNIEVQVGDEWKGVHVQNQSRDNGAKLIRHSGLGNRVKFIKSTEVPDGYHLMVDVSGEWTGVHIQNQSADDNAEMIRHSGNGNVFRILKNAKGTYNILVQASDNYVEWKGLHIASQRSDNGAQLIRHRGNGNEFRLQEIVSESSVSSGENDVARELLEGEYRVEVAVGGEWKGVHIQNQSRSDGAQLVRRYGAGNRVKFVKSTVVPGGCHMLIEVGGIWKGVSVQNQSLDDHASMIRRSGNGNIFKIVKNADGTYQLLVQVDFDYVDWRGVHVTSQHEEDGVPLVRHRGEGNLFRFNKVNA